MIRQASKHVETAQGRCKSLHQQTNWTPAPSRLQVHFLLVADGNHTSQNVVSLLVPLRVSCLNEIPSASVPAGFPPPSGKCCHWPLPSPLSCQEPGRILHPRFPTLTDRLSFLAFKFPIKVPISGFLQTFSRRSLFSAPVHHLSIVL